MEQQHIVTDVAQADARAHSPFVVTKPEEKGLWSTVLALLDDVAELLDRPPAASLLDVHMVDDDDVETRTGYGVLLSSIHHLPIQVWER